MHRSYTLSLTLFESMFEEAIPFLKLKTVERIVYAKVHGTRLEMKGNIFERDENFEAHEICFHLSFKREKQDSNIGFRDQFSNQHFTTTSLTLSLSYCFRFLLFLHTILDHLIFA